MGRTVTTENGVTGRLTDGDFETAWFGDPVFELLFPDNDTWFVLDLGDVYSVNTVQLWATDPTYDAGDGTKEFKVQFSRDNVHFVTVDDDNAFDAQETGMRLDVDTEKILRRVTSGWRVPRLSLHRVTLALLK